MADTPLDGVLGHIIENNPISGAPQIEGEAFGKVNKSTEFLQALRPADVVHVREQLLRWWSQPGEWQWRFALQGRRKLPGWGENRSEEAEGARWWIADTIRKAELYWVSPEMTEVITTLAPSIPDTLPQPPVPDAFVMFTKSVPGTDAETGDMIYTSAFLWGTANLYRIGEVVALETYAWRDLVQLYQGLPEKLQDRFREIYPMRLMPTGGSEWPLDVETSDFDKLPSDEPLMQQSILEDRKLLSTFWALASQRIVLETLEQPGGRQAMRRAQREGRKLDEVRVIRLREPATRSRGDAGSDVEWSHRWIVGKHWRNQWYPASGQHRPKIIEAYQKGPADKPLVVRETVRALVR
jgi:hypothetical protein